MQVRRAIVDAEQRWHVEPIRSKRDSGSGVVADLYGIVRIERTYLFQIVDGAGPAGAGTGERLELVRRGADAGVRRCHGLTDRRRLVTVEDLALRPFDPTVTGCTIVSKDGPPAVSGGWIIGPRLEQRADRGKDPQGLHIKGVARPLYDTMVVDGWVDDRCVPLHETRIRPAGVEIIAGETATPLVNTGVGVEVGVAAAHSAPVHQFLIGRVLLVEHGIQRSGLARPGAKNVGCPVGQPVQMAGPAAAPGVLRHLTLEIPWDDVADRGALKAVIRDTEGCEESDLADQDIVLEAARGRGLAGGDVLFELEAQTIGDVH